MSKSKTKSRKGRSRSPEFVQKPSGVIHPRVQKVGPEHFGIVCVDCAKARSKWMLADFYGTILVPPVEVEHQRPKFDQCIAELRAAISKHDLRDVLVAIERTGRYHHLPKNAFQAAGFEVRILHPFATKQFRLPSDPGVKTDDTDLMAHHRATVNGFALLEAPVEDNYLQLQMIIRHRRDLVFKCSALCSQIREHLHAAMPGYAACFDNFWTSNVALHLVREYGSAQALVDAGQDAVRKQLRNQEIRFQSKTLERAFEWAKTAAPPDLAAERHRRIALALDDDRRRKTLEIKALERESAAFLVRTPYVLLLSFPGINVVSAADFVGEMGPITNYANARAITGRAGLFPSRYQSDRVDHADGPLVRRCNRKLRAAILGIADNLLTCNHHCQALATRWRTQGKEKKHTHVKIAVRFCRIAYQMVAGRQVFRHPGLQTRSYILDKLMAFQRDHDTPVVQAQQELYAAIDHIPQLDRADEAKPLLEEKKRIDEGRRRGPQVLGDLLPLVLARLGVGVIQSTESVGIDPR